MVMLEGPTKTAVVEDTIVCWMAMSEDLDKICRDKEVIAYGVVMLEDANKYFHDRVAQHFKWRCYKLAALFWKKKNHIPFDNPTMISSIYYWKWLYDY